MGVKLGLVQLERTQREGLETEMLLRISEPKRDKGT
jgi:hypothetical protein